MNYTRRANRPDANYYRETRRRGLRRSDGRGGHRSRGRGWLLLLLILALVATGVGLLMWRGI